MPVSLPVSLPPTVTPGGKPAAAPGKGSAHAHGLTGDPAKGGPAGKKAADVADMFAALVAAVTAQMQPAADATAQAQVPAESEPSQGDAPAPAVPTLTAPVADAVPVQAATDLGDAGPEGLADPAAGLPADDAGLPVQTPDQGGDTGEGQSAEHRAAPAVRAIPATHDDGETTPAQRAQPAQPAVQIIRGEAPASIPTPVQGTDEADPAVNPVSATPAARVERPEATSRVIPAAPARPAEAHVQVARVVRPLRLGADGAYELALDLTPAELGRVRIDVELRGSTISLNLRADNPATRELLQSSLEQLRAELEAAGLQAGQFDVGGRGPHDPGAAESDYGSDITPSDDADELLVVAPTLTDPADFDPSNGLDVRA